MDLSTTGGRSPGRAGEQVRGDLLSESIHMDLDLQASRYIGNSHHKTNKLQNVTNCAAPGPIWTAAKALHTYQQMVTILTYSLYIIIQNIFIILKINKKYFWHKKISTYKLGLFFFQLHYNNINC